MTRSPRFAARLVRLIPPKQRRERSENFTLSRRSGTRFTRLIPTRMLRGKSHSFSLLLNYFKHRNYRSEVSGLEFSRLEARRQEIRPGTSPRASGLEA